MPRLADKQRLIERFCTGDDLRTFDPYDVWKTGPGFAVRELFNRHRILGMLPAAALTIVDTCLNNRLRIGYRRQEYPVVRAWAALALLNLYESSRDDSLLVPARRHLTWLVEHASPGGHGTGWGIGFRQSISAGLVYPAELPLATMTPYALEAFVRHQELTGNQAFRPVLDGIYRFFRDDLVTMEETPEYLVTSYGPLRDRKVVNAVSYHLYSLALLLPFLDAGERAAARQRLDRLYRYVESSQRQDGSWLYSPDGPPFIDCFHSCIVLKNLVKADRVAGLPGSTGVVGRGYAYVKREFRSARTGLFRRFTVENKPSLVRYDLYDNAEMLSLAGLLGDAPLVRDLASAIQQHFVRGDVIFSQIDRFGFRHNRNMLRWAVLPYLHALTTRGVDAHVGVA